MFQDTLDIDASRMRLGSAKQPEENRNGEPPQQQLTNPTSKLGNVLHKDKDIY